MDKVIYVNFNKKERKDESCEEEFSKKELLDDLIESWFEAIAYKVQEIDESLGRQAAYYFYKNVCGTDSESAKLTVDVIVEDEDDDEFDTNLDA